MDRQLKIVGVSGSLRQDSVNKKLLDLVKTMLPENVEYEYADYSNVPVFNEDIEKPVPESVQKLKDQIEGADIVLFATPQYNGSYSGPLKNAIDWMTRPAGDNSIGGKVAGVIGGTPGQSGTIQAQLHLREVLSHLGVQVPAQPRVMISGIYDMLDDNGNLHLPEVEVENYKKLLDALFVQVEAKLVHA
ncbi:chromate reductase [Alkalibacillus filiformis]|uniref:Chromate reductase n=1 Tax=Alkalibacillus filiformis TaxID=200990 RepID=A0ABU0DUN9_9BACI|nr:NAD(P)H-dependent oxidoreductase [Alkalibacillus filiformis]MDQ0352070.1 chromate reductase [Alkalibacillus filiformis]